MHSEGKLSDANINGTDFEICYYGGTDENYYNQHVSINSYYYYGFNIRLYRIILYYILIALAK